MEQLQQQLAEDADFSAAAWEAACASNSACTAAAEDDDADAALALADSALALEDSLFVASLSLEHPAANIATARAEPIEILASLAFIMLPFRLYLMLRAPGQNRTDVSGLKDQS